MILLEQKASFDCAGFPLFLDIFPSGLGQIRNQRRQTGVERGLLIGRNMSLAKREGMLDANQRASSKAVYFANGDRVRGLGRFETNASKRVLKSDC